VGALEAVLFVLGIFFFYSFNIKIKTLEKRIQDLETKNKE